MKNIHRLLPAFTLLSFCFFSCGENKTPDYSLLVKEMNLKTGAVISCGPADKEFGEVSFAISANPEAAEDFNLGVKLLHSFEYDEAEKVFARIIN
ncbi:MAG: hypothetical protein EOO14_10540, partial [Chitinophagaceae bacterium]